MLGYVALTKQVKFADQRDFSLFYGFPDEWNHYGRYLEFWPQRYRCENTPGGFGTLEAVDGLCDSRPPQAAIFLLLCLAETVPAISVPIGEPKASLTECLSP